MEGRSEKRYVKRKEKKSVIEMHGEGGGGAGEGDGGNDGAEGGGLDLFRDGCVGDGGENGLQTGAEGVGIERGGGFGCRFLFFGFEFGQFGGDQGFQGFILFDVKSAVQVAVREAGKLFFGGGDLPVELQRDVREFRACRRRRRR